MPTDDVWLAMPTSKVAHHATEFTGEPRKAAWLPSESIARKWMQYVTDTDVADDTEPPGPTELRVKGNELSWKADADAESGLAHFIIKRDGEFLAKVPNDGRNRFGRPLFQNLQYSDTPTQPLEQMRFIDTSADPDGGHVYTVIAVNTAGLLSEPCGPNP